MPEAYTSGGIAGDSRSSLVYTLRMLLLPACVQPTDLAATGAAWLWEGDCRTVGEAWFRVELSLP